MDQDYCSKAEVIQNHVAQDSSQLDLRVGDFVYILEKDESGWWGGHKMGEDTTGWFPYNIVRLIDEVPPHHSPDALVPQNMNASFGVTAHETTQTHGQSQAALAPALKLDTKESNQSELQTQCESPTRKARWPASPMIQGQHIPRDAVQHSGPSNAQSPGHAERELLQIKEILKNERSKHKEELTVERGRRESLEAQRLAHNNEMAQMHEVQNALKRQISKLERDNAELRTRVQAAEVPQSQHTVGNEAEQLRRLQEQLSQWSRQEEKIWNAVEKNVSPAILMKIKADAPQEPVAQPVGGPTVEVARRLFSSGAAGGEHSAHSPKVQAKAESANGFIGNAHTSDSWAKPPTVPRSATQLTRPVATSREGTPVKTLTRPFSCTDLEPDEAPAKGAVANIVRRLERVGSTPPREPRRMPEQVGMQGKRNTPQNSPTASAFSASAWAPPLLIDGGDHDEPVNFGMSPISTARAQGRIPPLSQTEEVVSNSKSNVAGTLSSATPTSASCSSLVRNRIRQLEHGV